MRAAFFSLRHALLLASLLFAAYGDDSLPASVQGLVSTPFTAEPPVPTDLPLLVWLAVNDKVDPKNLPKAWATKSWPEEVVVKGLTLEVEPGHMPTLKASSTLETTPASSSSPTPTTSATATTTTSATTTTTQASANSSITRNAGEVTSDGDRKVAIVLGVLICLVAFSVLGVVMLLLWRRKRATGNFFKPARYSLASEMAGNEKRGTSEAALLSPSPVGHSSQQLDKDHDPGDVERAAEYFSATQLSRISEARDSDVYDGTRGPMTIRHVANRDSESQYSTAQSVDGYNPRLITPASARWADYVPSEQSFELSAESPSHMAVQRLTSQSQLEVVEEAVESEDTSSTPTTTQTPRLQSGFAPAARERRSMVVTMSPTNSSTSILEDPYGHDRTNTMSSYSTEYSERERGESLDTITSIVTPAPSYRDRRPADLLLPSATKRFRDQRLPLVHFPDETASPSPPYQNTSPPRHDSGAVLASRTSLSPSVSPLAPGLSPVASPSRVPERRVSPIGRLSPTASVVHYPSREEVRSFEFEPEPDEDSPPEPPPHRSSGYLLQPKRYNASGG